MSRTPSSPLEAARRWLSRSTSVGAALLVLLLITPAPLFGYIDPLSGSIILQVIAAGVFAGLLTVKRFWFRVRAAFGRLRTLLARR
jgi:hypothetical protein